MEILARAPVQLKLRLSIKTPSLRHVLPGVEVVHVQGQLLAVQQHVTLQHPFQQPDNRLG